MVKDKCLHNGLIRAINVSSALAISIKHMYKNKLTNVMALIKSRRMKWAGNVARMEEGRSAFKILTSKPTGKRPLGRPRRRWGDNVRMDLEE